MCLACQRVTLKGRSFLNEKYEGSTDKRMKTTVLEAILCFYGLASSFM